MPEPSRRGFMGAVAAAAFASYDDKDYGPADVQGWPLDQSYCTGSVVPEVVRAGIEGPLANIETPVPGATGERADVNYDSSGVFLGFDSERGDFSAWGGMRLDPDAAKELAAALYRAGWELEQRGSE